MLYYTMLYYITLYSPDKTTLTRRYAASSISVVGAGGRHTEAIAGARGQRVGVNVILPPLGVFVNLSVLGPDG